MRLAPHARWRSKSRGTTRPLRPTDCFDLDKRATKRKSRIKPVTTVAGRRLTGISRQMAAANVVAMTATPTDGRQTYKLERTGKKMVSAKPPTSQSTPNKMDERSAGKKRKTPDSGKSSEQQHVATLNSSIDLRTPKNWTEGDQP